MVCLIRWDKSENTIHCNIWKTLLILKKGNYRHNSCVVFFLEVLKYSWIYEPSRRMLEKTHVSKQHSNNWLPLPMNIGATYPISLATEKRAWWKYVINGAPSIMVLKHKKKKLIVQTQIHLEWGILSA